MATITFNRHELYKLVWSEPMSALSKKYGTSTLTLRNICTEMNIPIPNMGHWQKIHYGKFESIIELPTDYLGIVEYTLEITDKTSVDKVSGISVLKSLQKEIANNLELPLKVPSKLFNPDRLVGEAKDDLTLQKHPYGNYNGLMSTSGGLMCYYGCI